MAKKIARWGLLTAAAMALSWLESMLPAFGMVPGMKLGLANIVTLFALYRMSLRDAAGISLARVLLTAASFGNAYSFAYSLAGAAQRLVFYSGRQRCGGRVPQPGTAAGGHLRTGNRAAGVVSARAGSQRNPHGSRNRSGRRTDCPAGEGLAGPAARTSVSFYFSPVVTQL